MLRAELESSLGTENEVLIAASFRLAARSLSDETGRVLAELQDGIWTANAALYTALQFESDVSVEFESEATGEKLVIGPCRRLRIIGGAMWRTGDRHELIARLDGERKWQVLSDGGAMTSECNIRPLE